MTLVRCETIGTYTGTCYKELIADANLEDEFTSLTGESLAEHELDPLKQSEDALIHQVVETASEEFILHSDVTGMDERMYYALMKVEK